MQAAIRQLIVNLQNNQLSIKPNKSIIIDILQIELSLSASDTTIKVLHKTNKELSFFIDSLNPEESAYTGRVSKGVHNKQTWRCHVPVSIEETKLNLKAAH